MADMASRRRFRCGCVVFVAVALLILLLGAVFGWFRG
jgi:hypothetical protein